MIDSLKQIVSGSAGFLRLVESVAHASSTHPVIVTGSAGSLPAILVSLLQDKTARQVFLVARDRASAEKFQDDLRLAGAPTAYFDGRAPGQSSEGVRVAVDLGTLRSLAAGHKQVVVTHPHGLCSSIPAPSSVVRETFNIEAGQELEFAPFVRRLQAAGFERKDFVETFGDLSVRGGILDIFPFAGENPVRVEFAGDRVESLREFDQLSQRSIRDLAAAVIVPDLLRPKEDAADGTTEPANLLDYLLPDALVVMEEPDLVRAAVDARPPAPEGPGLSWKDLDELLAMFIQVHLISLPGATSGTIDFASVPQPAFNASVGVLRKTLVDLLDRGFRIGIGCDSQSELSRIRDLLQEIQPAEEEGETDRSPAQARMADLAPVEFSLDSLHEGFLLPGERLAVFTEHQIFNRLRRRGKRKPPKGRAFSENELLQLHKGDYVVHVDYGIGRFDGLRKIHLRNVEQEVVKLLYEEKDVLYVNLNYITRLRKYASKEGHIPKLTRLGGAEWERLKSRAKNRVKDIARELIQLYARRKHVSGFAFPPDTPWQREMEASFMYEDTFDQAKAALDVKRDMEAGSPMDRLVCGDVGFGKTEVAVRAAFKAVMSGKQVAVLVPTTILATQHYNTFLDRLSRYPVRVQVVSRFKSAKEQGAIVAQLHTGEIDVIIGTHRLLSKDVGFKNLGLLVIDEEHRFGVTAKEKLRQMRAEVDTLTLTATPIPRTLHFSLMGARDLSIIATPPRNRVPVLTEITQWNDDALREAVLREIHRGGQVYVVHDRIQTIQDVAARLQALLPQARIRVAHGQMHAHELENVMMDFLGRKSDLLVSTKIIESGLDIPNVNTIIINRADRFGMAELYQLRGRVGRSNVQAYAYLLTPPMSGMARTSIQRLQAVEEFTELGSGFNLAMRDLEIRGAGNLLGSEQSGFIEALGFETYTRILEEAVGELKEQEFSDLFPGAGKSGTREAETLVEADVPALIPQQYVEDDVERLSIYRRLYSLTTQEQLGEVASELQDRFGVLPLEARNLLSIVQIRLAASRLGVRKVALFAGILEAQLPPETDTAFYESENFQQLMTTISGMGRKGVAVTQEGKMLKLSVRLRAASPKNGDDQGGSDLLQQALQFLLNLQPTSPKGPLVPLPQSG